MIKVTNIQATRIIGVLLILLSGDAFAVTYATQPALNAEIFSRKSGDSTETIRATKAERTLKAADTAETARAKVAEGTLNKAIAAETARAKVAEAAGAGTTIADGTTTGDMLYWDETQIKWVVLPAPNPLPIAPAKATLSFCNGVPTWKVTCPPTDGLYKIGDIGQAGGIVFYITDAGLHGLEAAPIDQSSTGAPWGCYGTSMTGAYGTAVGTGEANTAAIVTSCNESNIAAILANNYVLNGYSDWFLPSLDELNLMYQQRNIVGGFQGAWNYWSSSEYDNGNAWAVDFTSGVNSQVQKRVDFNLVRSIRYF